MWAAKEGLSFGVGIYVFIFYYYYYDVVSALIIRNVYI